jgi:hypothetical protein
MLGPGYAKAISMLQTVFFGTDKTTGKEGEKFFNYGIYEDELRYEP